MKKNTKTFIGDFFVSFLEGVMIIAPLVITIWLVRFLVAKVNSMVLSPLMRLLMLVKDDITHVYIAKAIIFVSVILGIALIGWGAKVIFLRRIFSSAEKLFLKVPILGRIYKALKQVASAVSGENKAIFKSVVLVEYPRQGLYSVGFMTGLVGRKMDSAVGRETVNVFMPTTPNPTTGMLIVVPKENVKFLDMSVEDAMKLVISGGFVPPSGPGR